MWPPANPFIFLFNCIISAVCSFPFGFTLSLENLEPWNYEIEKFLQSRADLIYTKEDGTEFWRWEWNFGGHTCCKESGPGNSSISTYSDFADLEWDSDSGIFWKAFQIILPYVVGIENHWSTPTLFSDEAYQYLNGLFYVMQLSGESPKFRFHISPLKSFSPKHLLLKM